MADVHTAVDERLGREVAIKLLPIDGITPQERQRFVREARAIAGFSHPNVVTLYDAGEADGFLYLAMERVAGRTLTATIAAGPLDAATATSLTVEILSALDAAHRSGVIHRDVKPSNVLIDTEGHAKLVDFGIALRLDELAGDLTGTGQHIGTPKYMAPEVVSGGPPTPASDVYAVGVMLYEMLAGRPPFDAETPIATAMAHVNAPVPDVVAARPGTPTNLAVAVATAMAKDPSDRYASADAMRRAIDGSGGRPQRPVEPTQVMADSPPTARGRHGGRRIWIATVAAALAVGVVATVVVVRSGDDGPDGATTSSSSPAALAEAAASTTAAAPTIATTTLAPATTIRPALDAVETPDDLVALLEGTDVFGARTPDVVAALDGLGNGRKATDRAGELLDDAAGWVSDGELDPAVLDALQMVLAPIADGPGNGNGNGNR